MAWKELLQLHDSQEQSGPAADSGEGREKGSLIRQICELFGLPAGDGGAASAESAEAASPQVFQDGYVRRSPVQAYQTAADYHRRRIRKGIMAAVILVILVLLVLALIRSGFLAFRFR